MDSVQSARRDKRRTFVSAIGIVAAVMIVAPPVVQAATQKVNVVKSKVLTVKGTVGVSQLNGTVAPGQNNGSIPGETMGKSLNVSNLPAGEGLWGVGICEHPVEAEREVEIPAAGVGEPDNTISNVIVGSPDAATITLEAPDLPGAAGPVLIFHTSASMPSQQLDLSGGLRVSPSRIVLECTEGGSLTGPPGPATFAVTGH